MSVTSKAGPQLEPGPSSTERASRRQMELPQGAGPGPLAPPSRLDHWPRPGSLSGSVVCAHARFVPASLGPRRQPQLSHARDGCGARGTGDRPPGPLSPFPQCRRAVHSRVACQLLVLQQGAIVTHLEGGMASVHLLRPHVHTGPLPSANPSGLFHCQGSHPGGHSTCCPPFQACRGPYRGCTPSTCRAPAPHRQSRLIRGERVQVPTSWPAAPQQMRPGRLAGGGAGASISWACAPCTQ